MNNNTKLYIYVVTPLLLSLVILTALSILSHPLKPITMISKSNASSAYISPIRMLRDNLTMPDGRKYWDNNNATDVEIATKIQSEFIDKLVEGYIRENITLEQLFNGSETMPMGETYAGVYHGKV